MPYRRVAILLSGLLVLGGCSQMERARDWLPVAGSRKAKSTPTNPIELAGPPVKVGPQEKMGVQLALARSLEKQGKDDEAIRVYRDAIQKHGDRDEAIHRLAVLCDKQGRSQEAADYFAKALKMAPDNATLYCDVGYSHYLRGQWNEAFVHLNRALAIQPEYQRAHINMGMLLARTGRPAEAFAAFRRAGCSPSQAHANIGYASAFASQWQDSEHHFALALADDPENAQARRGRQMVVALAKNTNTTNPARDLQITR